MRIGRLVPQAAAAAAVAALAPGCLSKPGFECAVAPLPQMLEERVGTYNGSPHDPEDCGDRKWVVGVGFTLSKVADSYDEKATVTPTLRCAPLTDRDDRYATGSVVEKAVTGGSEPNIDGPFFADCPDGQVVTGISAHLIYMDGLVNSVSIDCSALDAGGAPAGATTQHPILATGNKPPDAHAVCAPGEALHGLKSWTGSKLDRLQLACSMTSCAPP